LEKLAFVSLEVVAPRSQDMVAGGRVTRGAGIRLLFMAEATIRHPDLFDSFPLTREQSIRKNPQVETS